MPALGDVVSAIKEIKDPHTLGIHLKIEDHHLEEFERNFPRDVNRQTTEVIKHWRRNFKDHSWNSLAAAVEKMERHGNLVTRLRELHSEAIRNAKLKEDKNIVDGCATKKGNDDVQ